jgi:peptide/nickel transport system substrate-binding protein
MGKLGYGLIVAVGLLSGSVALAAGTLVVCDDQSDPQSLDPHRQFSEKNHTLLTQIYDGLVRFNPRGHIEPALATSWERMDSLTMRFHLRRDVRFHNGEPLTAEAVRFTIDRYLDPQIAFPARSFLEHIERAIIVDDHTVDLVTRFPDGLLLHRLAAMVLIVPPGHLRQHGPHALEQHPVGTGDFRFDRWDRGRAIHLRANRDYWCEGHPLLEELVFRFATADEQLDLLMKGEVDIVTELPGTLTGSVQQDRRTQVLKQRTFWTVGALINNTPGSPLADVRVRRALNMAVDRYDLIRYDVRGNGSILATLTMPGQGGHNSELEPYPYDPQAARRLLEEAGVTLPLKLRTHVRAQSERSAKIIASHLRKIGIELEMRIFSDAQVLQSLNDPDEHWDIGIAGMPDPMCHSFFIQSVLLFSQSPFSLTRDAEFDRRLMEMASTLDEQERDRLGRELDRYVHDQALSLFTYQKIKTYGVREGVAFMPYVSGMPCFCDATAEPRQDQ